MQKRNTVTGRFGHSTRLGAKKTARDFCLKMYDKEGVELSISMDNSLGAGDGYRVIRSEALVFEGNFVPPIVVRGSRRTGVLNDAEAFVGMLAAHLGYRLEPDPDAQCECGYVLED